MESTFKVGRNFGRRLCGGRSLNSRIRKCFKKVNKIFLSKKRKHLNQKTMMSLKRSRLLISNFSKLLDREEKHLQGMRLLDAHHNKKIKKLAKNILRHSTGRWFFKKYFRNLTKAIKKYESNYSPTSKEASLINELITMGIVVEYNLRDLKKCIAQINKTILGVKVRTNWKRISGKRAAKKSSFELAINHFFDTLNPNNNPHSIITPPQNVNTLNADPISEETYEKGKVRRRSIQKGGRGRSKTQSGDKFIIQEEKIKGATGSRQHQFKISIDEPAKETRYKPKTTAKISKTIKTKHRERVSQSKTRKDADNAHLNENVKNAKKNSKKTDKSKTHRNADYSSSVETVNKSKEDSKKTDESQSFSTKERSSKYQVKIRRDVYNVFSHETVNKAQEDFKKTDESQSFQTKEPSPKYKVKSHKDAYNEPSNETVNKAQKDFKITDESQSFKRKDPSSKYKDAKIHKDAYNAPSNETVNKAQEDSEKTYGGQSFAIEEPSSKYLALLTTRRHADNAPSNETVYKAQENTKKTVVSESNPINKPLLKHKFKTHRDADYASSNKTVNKAEEDSRKTHVSHSFPIKKHSLKHKFKTHRDGDYASSNKTVNIAQEDTRKTHVSHSFPNKKLKHKFKTNNDADYKSSSKTISYAQENSKKTAVSHSLPKKKHLLKHKLKTDNDADYASADETVNNAKENSKKLKHKSKTHRNADYSSSNETVKNAQENSEKTDVSQSVPIKKLIKFKFKTHRESDYATSILNENIKKTPLGQSSLGKEKRPKGPAKSNPKRPEDIGSSGESDSPDINKFREFKKIAENKGKTNNTKRQSQPPKNDNDSYISDSSFQLKKERKKRNTKKPLSQKKRIEEQAPVEHSAGLEKFREYESEKINETESEEKILDKNPEDLPVKIDYLNIDSPELLENVNSDHRKLKVKVVSEAETQKPNYHTKITPSRLTALLTEDEGEEETLKVRKQLPPRDSNSTLPSVSKFISSDTIQLHVKGSPLSEVSEVSTVKENKLMLFDSLSVIRCESRPTLDVLASEIIDRLIEKPPVVDPLKQSKKDLNISKDAPLMEKIRTLPLESQLQGVWKDIVEKQEEWLTDIHNIHDDEKVRQKLNHRYILNMQNVLHNQVQAMRKGDYVPLDEQKKDSFFRNKKSEARRRKQENRKSQNSIDSQSTIDPESMHYQFFYKTIEKLTASIQDEDVERMDIMLMNREVPTNQFDYDLFKKYDGDSNYFNILIMSLPWYQPEDLNEKIPTLMRNYDFIKNEVTAIERRNRKMQMDNITRKSQRFGIDGGSVKSEHDEMLVIDKHYIAKLRKKWANYLAGLEKTPMEKHLASIRRQKRREQRAKRAEERRQRKLNERKFRDSLRSPSALYRQPRQTQRVKRAIKEINQEKADTLGGWPTPHGCCSKCSMIVSEATFAI